MNIVILSMTLLVASQIEFDPELKRLVKTKATECSTAILKGDYERILDLSHPRLIELSGGREKLLAQLRTGMENLKAGGTEIDSVLIGDPTKLVKAGSDLVTVVPTTTKMKNTLIGEFQFPGFLIGASSDDGKTWVFIDGSILDKERLLKIIPDFPEDLQLPKLAEIDFPQLVKTRLQIIQIKAQMQVLTLVMREYRLDLGDYPTTAQGLKALTSKPADLANPQKWAGPYLKKPAPLDPWDRPYRYKYAEGDERPKVWSDGPDKRNGTSDDIIAMWD